MNTPIGDKLFQDIRRRMAKFRENLPRDVEKSVDGKKKLDGCIMWNAHNTVFGSKRSAICATVSVGLPKMASGQILI